MTLGNEIRRVFGANQFDKSGAEAIGELAVAPNEQGAPLLAAIGTGDVPPLDVEDGPTGQVRPPAAGLVVDRDVADDEAERQLDRGEAQERVLPLRAPIAQD